MDYKTIRVERDSRGLLTVTLNRPDIRNAFNEVMIKELRAAFEVEAVDPGVKVILLKGEGPVFCAGGDLNWMKKAVTYNYEENLRDTSALTKMFSILNECPRPVIGAVHGAAIGGGVGLVSVCDMVVATAETQFSLSEVRLGIVPSCIGPFVLAKIGASQARSLFISAERFQSDFALSIGLIHKVVKGREELDSEVSRLIKNILLCGPNAVAVAKRLVLDLSWPEHRAMNHDCLDYVAKTLADLRVSPEGREGITAFLEKRKPSWML